MAKVRFGRDANIILVDVFIKNLNRQKIVRMALDTGATYTMIPWEVADSLGLQPELTREKIETVTASGVEMVPIVDLPVVAVGSSEARNIRAIIHDLPTRSFVDGLLGLSFLRHFNLNVDFEEGFFELIKT
ncbi:MAG: retroviral-like aspartic protease family protein [Candidatus Marinimicrobia bacterium]|nr:retroviral-like aspartic protease family protein [Candidatus Neomarinimicrobiota bacterium]